MPPALPGDQIEYTIKQKQDNIQIKTIKIIGEGLPSTNLTIGQSSSIKISPEEDKKGIAKRDMEIEYIENENGKLIKKRVPFFNIPVNTDGIKPLETTISWDKLRFNDFYKNEDISLKLLIEMNEGIDNERRFVKNNLPDIRIIDSKKYEIGNCPIELDNENSSYNKLILKFNFYDCSYKEKYIKEGQYYMEPVFSDDVIDKIGIINDIKPIDFKIKELPFQIVVKKESDDNSRAVILTGEKSLDSGTNYVCYAQPVIDMNKKHVIADKLIIKNKDKDKGLEFKDESTEPCKFDPGEALIYLKLIDNKIPHTIFLHTINVKSKPLEANLTILPEKHYADGSSIKIPVKIDINGGTKEEQQDRFQQVTSKFKTILSSGDQNICLKSNDDDNEKIALSAVTAEKLEDRPNMILEFPSANEGKYKLNIDDLEINNLVNSDLDPSINIEVSPIPWWIWVLIACNIILFFWLIWGLLHCCEIDSSLPCKIRIKGKSYELFPAPFIRLRRSIKFNVNTKNFDLDKSRNSIDIHKVKFHACLTLICLIICQILGIICCYSWRSYGAMSEIICLLSPLVVWIVWYRLPCLNVDTLMCSYIQLPGKGKLYMQRDKKNSRYIWGIWHPENRIVRKNIKPAPKCVRPKLNPLKQIKLFSGTNNNKDQWDIISKRGRFKVEINYQGKNFTMEVF
ncbi:membrane hypothetical protein [Candidatus Magnetomoraceae bacterium gMMP-15]